MRVKVWVTTPNDGVQRGPAEFADMSTAWSFIELIVEFGATVQVERVVL